MTTTWSTPPAQAADVPDGRRPFLSRRRGLAAGLLGLLLLGGVGLAGYGAGRGHALRAGGGLVPLPPAGAGPHVVVGVPIGYPHNEAGARSAAVNYEVAIGSQALFVPGQRHALLAAITDPAQLHALQAKYDAAIPQVEGRFGLDENGQPLQAELRFVNRIVPVGVKTSGYTPDTALITVWESSLVGLAGQGSTQPVTERWATTTVTLRWAAGDWKYASETGQLGPVPVVGVQAPSDSSEVATAAQDFGGLTYAG